MAELLGNTVNHLINQSAQTTRLPRRSPMLQHKRGGTPTSIGEHQMLLWHHTSAPSDSTKTMNWSNKLIYVLPNSIRTKPLRPFVTNTLTNDVIASPEAGPLSRVLNCLKGRRAQPVGHSSRLRVETCVSRFPNCLVHSWHQLPPRPTQMPSNLRASVSYCQLSLLNWVVGLQTLTIPSVGTHIGVLRPSFGIIQQPHCPPPTYVQAIGQETC